MRACREVTAKPLYAKVSPHMWDMGETVRAVEEAGADGLSMINTLRGVDLDAVARGRRLRVVPAATRDRR